jgi:hypothetical protein
MHTLCFNTSHRRKKPCPCLVPASLTDRPPGMVSIGSQSTTTQRDRLSAGGPRLLLDRGMGRLTLLLLLLLMPAVASSRNWKVWWPGCGCGWGGGGARHVGVVSKEVCLVIKAVDSSKLSRVHSCPCHCYYT